MTLKMPEVFDIRLTVDLEPTPGRQRYYVRIEFSHEGVTMLAGAAGGNDRNALVSWAFDNARDRIHNRLRELESGMQLSVSVEPTVEPQAEVRVARLDYHKIHRRPGHRKGWGVSVELKAKLDEDLDKGTVTQLMLCDHNHRLVRTFLYTEESRKELDEFNVPEHFYLIHDTAKGG